MPDITMCKNASCPSAKKCYRFTAKPSDMQSYFTDMAPEKGEKKCEYFMKIYTNSQFANRDIIVSKTAPKP